MRIAVFAIAAVEFMIWLAVVIWASNVRPGLDLSIAHGLLLFLVLPAALIGAWGRWLPLALGLLGFAAQLAVSVPLAGMISN